MSIEQDEEWRDVPGYPGVRASSLGRVHRVSDEGLRGWGARSRPTYGSITTTKAKVAGGAAYSRRYVRWRGWPGNLYVATLVALAFHGRRPPKAVVMHLDDDSLRNVPSNLRWATQRENLNSPTTKRKLDAIRRAANAARWGKAREEAQRAA